jgi:hypothetical protein
MRGTDLWIIVDVNWDGPRSDWVDGFFEIKGPEKVHSVEHLYRRSGQGSDAGVYTNHGVISQIHPDAHALSKLSWGTNNKLRLGMAQTYPAPAKVCFIPTARIICTRPGPEFRPQEAIWVEDVRIFVVFRIVENAILCGNMHIHCHGMDTFENNQLTLMYEYYRSARDHVAIKLNSKRGRQIARGLAKKTPTVSSFVV